MKRKSIKKNTFNERKYHESREWQTPKENKPLNLKFIKHKSGKNTPISLKELIIYMSYIVTVTFMVDNKGLSTTKEIIFIIIITTPIIYILRQAKIRGIKKM